MCYYFGVRPGSPLLRHAARGIALSRSVGGNSRRRRSRQDRSTGTRTLALSADTNKYAEYSLFVNHDCARYPHPQRWSAGREDLTPIQGKSSMWWATAQRETCRMSANAPGHGRQYVVTTQITVTVLDERALVSGGPSPTRRAPGNRQRSSTGTGIPSRGEDPQSR